MTTGPKRKPTSQITELDELKKQIAELTNALQHERADATNVRRRAEEDRLKMATYFKTSVIKELLDFIDNFDRALLHAPNTADKAQSDWIQGLVSVDKQLKSALVSLGVEKIKTIGEVFDPRIHEAVHMDDSGEGTNEVITEEFKPGYIMDGEVLRHAMVKVALK